MGVAIYPKTVVALYMEPHPRRQQSVWDAVERMGSFSYLRIKTLDTRKVQNTIIRV
jgi:hypothetical protein